jgi:hypothetical protein
MESHATTCWVMGGEGSWRKEGAGFGGLVTTGSAIFPSPALAPGPNPCAKNPNAAAAPVREGDERSGEVQVGSAVTN